MVAVKEIDALLPQTQCGECGYPGCLPYAEALAQGSTTINKCPPGGVQLVKALGALLQVDAQSYIVEAQKNTRAPAVAVINEDDCIGCTKCIKACPVDAIIGSAKMMHAIIDQECTGCGLCIAPCPVDCIEMHTLSEPVYDPDLARTRYRAKQTRLLREAHEKQQAYREKSRLAAQTSSQALDIKAKQDYIQHALARVAAKRTK